MTINGLAEKLGVHRQSVLYHLHRSKKLKPSFVVTDDGVQACDEYRQEGRPLFSREDVERFLSQPGIRKRVKDEWYRTA